MNNLTVLLVDDEPGIRRLIKEFLIRENIDVIEACDGNDALLKYYENESIINLVILDVMMPYLDGFEVLSKIRESSNVPIIMLTAKSEEESQIQGLDSGANDYVTKPFSPIVLVSRVKSQLRNLQPSETKFGNVKIDNAKRKVFVDNEDVYMTLKEYELLNYLIKNVNVAISREDLLLKIWNEKDGDSRTVDTHIKQLRAKMINATLEIETVRGFGYMITENK